ncbi:hypothetical protein ABTF02_18665, partial [Acinetobacter baumannii]
MPAAVAPLAAAKAAATKPLPPPEKPAPPPSPPAKAPPAIGVTLDGGWDRRLAMGRIAPDSSIDLHGHSLDSAY